MPDTASRTGLSHIGHGEAPANHGLASEAAWRGIAALDSGLLSAARLQSLLGLDDEELLTILDSDPLAVITGEEDSRPEVKILLDLLQEAEERAGAPVLRRWVRTGPIDLLLRRDFAGFEDALAELAERGFILRRR